MKFGKGQANNKGSNKNKDKDKTVIHYNNYITIRNIPLEAYDYVINGKSAIAWVMERQSVTMDKPSGIVKDANDYAIETMNDPRYPLSLLLRVITVSLETMKIINSLPALDILEEDPAQASVLPFRKVIPQSQERYKTCVPLITLQAAAGGWGDIQESILEPSEAGVEWIAWDGCPKFTEGMFVAQVCGRSMEPLIPDGCYCLFRRVDLPSSPERAVLVRYSGVVDSETGGQFTVKQYRAERGRVLLRAVNQEFGDIGVAEGVRVIGEVVGVVGA
jgi:SOS-response transcriptional repressor LexA